MTGAELEAAMDTMRILVDTREKKNAHIITSLEGRKCPYTAHKLDYGDYSCEYRPGDSDPVSIESVAVIERKASLDELAGNITRHRDRFEREFLRAREAGAKVFLMVESGSDGYDQIQAHRYRSQLPPKAYLNTLFSWQQKYNITISFVSKQFAGDYVYATLFMALKNYLLHGLH